MAEARYLLDSNICIYLLEALSEEARRRVEQCRPGEIVTSSVAYGEVSRGLDPANAEGRRRLEALFDIVEVLPFDRQAAEAYALLPFRRTSYERLIAAHALSRRLVLVTNNVKDFRNVPGLVVENWTKS